MDKQLAESISVKIKELTKLIKNELVSMNRLKRLHANTGKPKHLREIVNCKNRIDMLNKDISNQIKIIKEGKYVRNN